jgi:hypothetical protein
MSLEDEEKIAEKNIRPNSYCLGKARSLLSITFMNIISCVN